jgi:Phytanoyl-CoA dioxygenase (PhyH)
MTPEHTTITAAPRAVTDREVAHYVENGWAQLPGFIGPELAAEMLAAGEEIMADALSGQSDEEAAFNAGVRIEKMGGKVANIGYWQDYHYVGRDDQREPFHTFIYSKAIGGAAQRFLNRDVGVRYSSDMLACKTPKGQAGGAATQSHQDISSLPFDRIGSMNVWIALKDLTPEHGTMRFLSGSHRAGNLGRTRAVGKGTIEYYPSLLDEYETSPPLAMKAGDATVHNAQVVHWAPENTTDEPRWSYILAYFPDDALYTGAPNHNFDGIALEVNKPFDHARFRRVYP